MDIRELALKGASVRIAELTREIKEIQQAFPELTEDARRQALVARAAHARAVKAARAKGKAKNKSTK